MNYIKCLVLLAPILLVSCDCIQVAKGYVIDAATGQPVKDATCHKKNKTSDEGMTDSTGFFEIRSVSGGLLGCPPMTVVVE